MRAGRIILLLALMMPGLALRADETGVVQQLRASLGMELPQADTVMPYPGRLPEGLKLRVTHDATTGEVATLGLALFGPELRQALHPLLWQSTERVLLSLLLLPNDKERERWLKARGIRLFAGTQRYGTPRFNRLARIVPVLRRPDRLEVLVEDERIKVLVGDEDAETQVRLSLPKNRELLSGTDKKEADERLALTLQQWPTRAEAPAPPALDETQLEEASGLRCLPGEAVQTVTMRSDAYYEAERDTLTGDMRLKPVLGIGHPTQSVCNLLLGRVMPDSLQVNIEHHQYGHKVRCWQQPWAQMIDAMSQHGDVKLYASCRPEPQQGHYTGILLALDELTASAHMMLVSVPEAWLERGGGEALDAMLFGNIPLANVKTLLR